MRLACSMLHCMHASDSADNRARVRGRGAYYRTVRAATARYAGRRSLGARACLAVFDLSWDAAEASPAFLVQIRHSSRSAYEGMTAMAIICRLTHR